MNKNTLGLTAGVLLLVAIGWSFYKFYPASNLGTTAEALTMSAVVLVGLVLIVLLMALLVIVYWFLGLANPTQALALPEGSIRALIAFSLVLVFVCMASFLYNSVNTVELSPGVRPLTKITEVQLTELKTQFVVAYEPARKADGSLETDADGKTPLYNATYFSKRSSEADDFAKQIFTTLATIFVSVISFYFGSSATSAGVGVGAKAALIGGDEGKKGVQSALAESQTAAHEAQAAVDRATESVTEAKSLAAAAPDGKKAAVEADVTAAQKALDTTTLAARNARQQVDAAQKAVADASSAGADAAKASKALSDAAKAQASAREFADKAKLGADEADRLLKKIKSDIEQ